MIRHRLGDEFLLITQNDHALFAGHLAAHLGNERFAPPSPFLPTVDAIAMHDSGWPLHDDQPTLNSHGQPLDVFETPLAVAIDVWNESVNRAAAVHPWSGLLVSLHVLRLSTFAPVDATTEALTKFQLNKFQHHQIETQERLRRSLGLRVDLPLTLGLATPGLSDKEDLLLFNAGWLFALDGISLDACSERALFPTLDRVFPRPDEPPISLRLGHPAPFVVTLDPWPFDSANIAIDVPCKRLGSASIKSLEAFRDQYRQSALDSVQIRIKAN